MGTMCVPSKTLCPTLKGCKWRYLVFHRKRLEPRVLLWQQHSMCHSVSFVMYIAGAKLEEHCLNISGVINHAAMGGARFMFYPCFFFF